MFFSLVKIGSYRIGSIRIGSFRLQVYSGRFLSVLVLSDKKILNPKVLVNIQFGFGSSIFRPVPVRIFRMQVKMPRPSVFTRK